MSLVDKLRTQKLLTFTLVLVTLSIGVVLGTLISSGVNARDNAQAPDAKPLVIPSPVELSNAFTQIAKQVEPSVVNISVTYEARNARRGRKGQQDDGSGDGMDEFFRFFSPFGGGAPEVPEGRGGTGLGSGVLVDSAGYILTNNHVIDHASRIRVKFFGDLTQYDAKLIGTDPLTDLAVIRVEGKRSMVAAKIGNSDAVQVGRLVDGNRVSFWLRCHRDGRHHQREGTHRSGRFLTVPALHPDRCRDQPGQ